MVPPQDQTSKFTDDMRKEILAALTAKAPSPRCPLCGHTNWQLNDGFVFFVLQKNLDQLNLSGQGIPGVSISCGQCGNTQFLNAITLGLRHLLHVQAEKPPDTKTG